MKVLMRVPALLLLLILGCAYLALAATAKAGMIADDWLAWVDERIDGIGWPLGGLND